GIQIPIDYETEKHRGFAFIEFELAEVSLINLYANITIRVNIAKPMRIKEGSSRPVWSDDDWLKKFSGTTAEEAEVTESTGESSEPPAKKGRTNPQVYMDIKIGNKPAGRLRFLLRADIAPMPAENFLCLCTHEKGVGFKGSCFHHVIPQFMCQGGDFTNHNGTGCKSIYGRKFEDENFVLKHTAADCKLTLSISNPKLNLESVSYFTTKVLYVVTDCEEVVYQDSCHVVCHHTQQGTKEGKTKQKVIILDCGDYV
uniref:Peptidyl-prolyl cis-trans isomerase n=1 Tax=Oncorhynchus mykiss TaxID=8022 RepID=A0A8C7SSZ5_ONCMY